MNWPRSYRDTASRYLESKAERKAARCASETNKPKDGEKLKKGGKISLELMGRFPAIPPHFNFQTAPLPEFWGERRRSRFGRGVRIDFCHPVTNGSGESAPNQRM